MSPSSFLLGSSVVPFTFLVMGSHKKVTNPRKGVLSLTWLLGYQVSVFLGPE